jgi:hypothetical protein
MEDDIELPKGKITDEVTPYTNVIKRNVKQLLQSDLNQNNLFNAIMAKGVKLMSGDHSDQTLVDFASLLITYKIKFAKDKK